ncbi:MAG TPA: hypothetical protein VN631_13145 [Negativicutes bacterium]|nr:hypothetical protein [Negativicutes bacterium]
MGNIFSYGGCFPTGTKILMSDYSSKNIESLTTADSVIGIEKSPLKVLAVYPLYLGSYQGLWKFPDDSLMFSSDHAFWVRKNGEDWWGTHDIHHWLRGEELLDPYVDIQSGLKVNFGKLSKKPLILTGGEQFAHISGWVTQSPVMARDQLYQDNYIVWMVVTEGSHTMIANGYVVSALVSDTNGEYDFSAIKWDGLVIPSGS